MANQWDAEHILEPHRVLAIINEQFPALKPSKIKFMEAGWDNTAYLVNDECPSLEREGLRSLAYIAQQVE